ncbi:aspartyl/asparaginyl beta-hydroxylase-like [Dreissena polymorpha]|uniref:aspartyl/asparaginyl beta-hydroxylase-like n=1 Tax=Dreissena polymorpha TaxID=45954 RepID=UPI002263EA6B|nr:aspartyl/asparaginyl beta-hydroxylase-like [Dreissena polymorpha]
MGPKKVSNSLNSATKTEENQSQPQPVKRQRPDSNKSSVNNVASSSSPNSKTFLLVALSLLVATTAVILTNDDVKMFLIQFTSIGSNTLEEVAKYTDSAQYVEEETEAVSEKSSQTHDIGKDSAKRSKLHASSPVESGTKGEKLEKESDDQETREGVNNIATQSVKVDEVLTEGSDTKNVEKDHTESDEADKEIKKESEEDQKAKSKRESYENSAITSKGDFKIRKRLDEADKALQMGELKKALDLFDDILKNKSQSPRALWGKGQVLDKLAEQQKSNKMLEEGMALMDKALRLSKTPDLLRMRIAEKLGDRQAFRGWSRKEAETWRYMMERYPNMPEFPHKLGTSYLKTGQNELARELFTNLLKENPEDGFSLVHLGFILKITDLNYTGAIPMLQKGIDSRQPGTLDGRFFYHLGDAYMRTSNNEMARKVYQEGAKAGLFLSADQRSLYNAETKITGRPWWTPAETTYLKYLTILENNWETIRDEGLAQLDQTTGSFSPEEENLRETGDWKQFTLYQRGRKNENHCRKVPRTCALLDQIPEANGCRRGQIKYSVMHPGVHVWPHTGPTNCRIRAHLGLKVPQGPRIRVGNETRTWKEGKFIIFDDSFEHEVWHDGIDFRLVLIVDFWHPEIPEHERRSLSPI